MGRTLAIGLLLGSGIGLVPAAARESGEATLVLTGGRVFTGDPARPWGEAVAVRGDRILAVGRSRDIQALAGGGARRVDLAGRFAMPGINDAHIHFLRGCSRLSQVDLNGAATLEEMQRRIVDYAKRNPAGPGDAAAWVLGYGWQYSALPGQRLPTRADLDAVISDRPVFLAAYDGHTGWANSRGLELAGVTGESRFEGWGEIVKDATGAPTGVLKEQAMRLVTDGLPPVPHERQLDAARRGLALLASLGITSIQNAHGTPAEVELFRELRDAGELTLRVGVAQTLRPPVTKEQVDAIRALAARYADGPLRVGAVKLVVDGVVEAHTAAMLAPYADEPGTRGLPAWSQEHLNQVVAWVDAAGLQIYVHAIGDGGVRMALDAFAHARRVNGRRDARHRVEHIETVDLADVTRFRELEVLASMMPIHADPGTIEAWAKAAGPDRTSRAFAWRLLERAGARLVFSSDWPSTLTVDPWRGLHCAVNRRTAEGRPPRGWLPEHAVSVMEALTAYTSAGAHAEFQEGEKGILAPGRFADIVVLSADPFALPPDRLHSLRALLTISGGKVVYEAP